jgi:hypothetical protein
MFSQGRSMRRLATGPTGHSCGARRQMVCGAGQWPAALSTAQASPPSPEGQPAALSGASGIKKRVQMNPRHLREHAEELRGRQHLCYAAALCRRRHQPRRPALAKIRPGSPAPAIGPGTARKPLISPPGNAVVWMFMYVSPARRAAINTGSAVAAVPPKAGLSRLYVDADVRSKVWS